MNPALCAPLPPGRHTLITKSPAAKADSYDFLMDNPRGRVSRPLPFPGYICRRAFLRKQQNPSSSDLRCHCQPGLLRRPLPFHACRIPRPSISFPYRSPTDLLFTACLHGRRFGFSIKRSNPFCAVTMAFPEISCSVPCISSFFSPSTPIPARRMPTPPKAFLSRNPSASPSRCP